nr:bifunctional DNA primase/polymerase [Kibdelosporangium sp. MJ126-NF4]CEL23363.1 prophage Lp4 protein 7, DNA replication [Kibdelosporangium sp. MJ126-NF4]CTQ96901.1 prophage Lp4 protein 7, DNA replication [Kibdelosporangium sp. MJ126-NF4]
MSNSDLLLEAAVAAADRGWPVFLLGRSKRPLANCEQCPKRGKPGAHDPETCTHLTCHGFYAATTDVNRLDAMIAAHPDGLLAVRTGAAPVGAGVVVIDIDPGHGGRYDPDLMAPTRCTATGNHGWHLFYRHPEQPVLSRPLPGRDGVDVKADGGYVVLPPSIHPITHLPYRWAADRDTEEMPLRLARLVLAPAAASTTAPTVRFRTRAPRGTGTQAGQAIRHPERLVESCLNSVRQAPEGRRRVTLYGAARGLARVILAGHLTPETGIALLTDAGRDANQTDRDIHAAITDGFTAEGLTPHGIAR